jgi:hypothetical protein
VPGGPGGGVEVRFRYQKSVFDSQPYWSILYVLPSRPAISVLDPPIEREREQALAEIHSRVFAFLRVQDVDGLFSGDGAAVMCARMPFDADDFFDAIRGYEAAHDVSPLAVAVSRI